MNTFKNKNHVDSYVSFHRNESDYEEASGKSWVLPQC